MRVQQQPRLEYFVLNILDHCNLRCKGCDHFSPLAEERFVSLENIINDLHQMSVLTDKCVSKIGIMGGEPLLHPHLPEIFAAARKEFPNTVIRLVSNGILLLKQDDAFWDACRDYNILLELTKYPINLDYDKIMRKCNSEGVDFKFYGSSGKVEKTLYKMPMDVEGMQDTKRSFWNCYHVNTCILVMEGKIYPCTIIPNAVHFNKKFNTHMELEKGDFLDIYSVNNLEELLSFVSKPKPFCRYCKTADRSYGYEWGRSKQEISEWT